MARSSSPLFVRCMVCDGEGRFPVYTHLSREDGLPDGYCEPCEICNGTGVMEIEGEPIELEDLPPPRDQ